MFYIGVGLGIFAFLGLLILLVEWKIKSKTIEKERIEQQWRAMSLIGLNQVAQHRREAEQAEQRAIQNQHLQLQMNLVALEAEIQALQASKSFFSQQGLAIPEQLELWLQKQGLEKKFVALEMQGVNHQALYDDIRHQIEQLNTQLEITNRGEIGKRFLEKQGEIGKVVIEQQGEIRNCLQQIAQKQAVALEELKKELGKRFTPAEVQNIHRKTDDVLKELLSMMAGLSQNPQRLSSS